MVRAHDGDVLRGQIHRVILEVGVEFYLLEKRLLRPGHVVRANDRRFLVPLGHCVWREQRGRADREKGRLRTFLLGALQNYLANEYDRVHTLKRGGGQQIVSMDDGLVAAEAAIVASQGLDDTGTYDQAWVATLVSRAWQRLEAEFVNEGKAQTLAELRPFLLGGTATLPSQEEVAARLGISFVTFRTILRRARQRYRDSLREKVARTLADPAQADEELRYLYRLMLT